MAGAARRHRRRRARRAVRARRRPRPRRRPAAREAGRAARGHRRVHRGLRPALARRAEPRALRRPRRVATDLVHGLRHYHDGRVPRRCGGGSSPTCRTGASTPCRRCAPCCRRRPRAPRRRRRGRHRGRGGRAARATDRGWSAPSARAAPRRGCGAALGSAVFLVVAPGRDGAADPVVAHRAGRSAGRRRRRWPLPRSLGLVLCLAGGGRSWSRPSSRFVDRRRWAPRRRSAPTAAPRRRAAPTATCATRCTSRSTGRRSSARRCCSGSRCSWSTARLPARDGVLRPLSTRSRRCCRAVRRASTRAYRAAVRGLGRRAGAPYEAVRRMSHDPDVPGRAGEPPVDSCPDRDLDGPGRRCEPTWGWSCRSTAAPPSPTPSASSGSPAASSRPSRPATTSSSSSPPWATPPTSSSTSPSRSPRCRTRASSTCC